MSTIVFKFDVDGQRFTDLGHIGDASLAGMARSATRRAAAALSNVDCGVHPSGTVTSRRTAAPARVKRAPAMGLYVASATSFAG